MIDEMDLQTRLDQHEYLLKDLGREGLARAAQTVALDQREAVDNAMQNSALDGLRERMALAETGLTELKAQKTGRPVALAMSAAMGLLAGLQMLQGVAGLDPSISTAVLVAVSALTAFLGRQPKTS